MTGGAVHISSTSFALFNRFLCPVLLPLSGYGGLLVRHLNAAGLENTTNLLLGTRKPTLFYTHTVQDASGCRSIWPDPAQLFRPGQDGLHDGVCSRNGCWRHVWHFLLSQDRHAWQGADGGSREDHDAERGDVRHLHGHRYGNPLLRTRNNLLHNTTVQLWDSSSKYNHSSLSARCCRAPNSSSFVNKSSHLSKGFQSGCVTLSDAVNVLLRLKTAKFIWKENPTCSSLFPLCAVLRRSPVLYPLSDWHTLVQSAAIDKKLLLLRV